MNSAKLGRVLLAAPEAVAVPQRGMATLADSYPLEHLLREVPAVGEL